MNKHFHAIHQALSRFSDGCAFIAVDVMPKLEWQCSEQTGRGVVVASLCYSSNILKQQRNYPNIEKETLARNTFVFYAAYNDTSILDIRYVTVFRCYT